MAAELRFNRFQIITDHSGHKRLQLYFGRTLPQEINGKFTTNRTYDSLLSKLCLDWYDYIFTQNWSLNGVNLVLLNNGELGRSPWKRTDYNLYTLAKLLLRLDMITTECAAELSRCQTDIKSIYNKSCPPSEDKFPACKVGGWSIPNHHYQSGQPKLIAQQTESSSIPESKPLKQVRGRNVSWLVSIVSFTKVATRASIDIAMAMLHGIDQLISARRPQQVAKLSNSKEVFFKTKRTAPSDQVVNNPLKRRRH